MRDLAISCDRLDCNSLRADWNWLVPADHRPLMIGAFGDWVFAAPDGSAHVLCLLEGDYRRVADSLAAFDRLKADRDNLNDWFKADWVEFAAARGMVPGPDECLGWSVHPIFGAPLSIDNIQIFPLAVHQTIMGQIFRQYHER